MLLLVGESGDVFLLWIVLPISILSLFLLFYVAWVAPWLERKTPSFLQRKLNGKLNSPDPNTRLEAVKLARKHFTNAQGTALLLPMLRDENANIRHQALYGAIDLYPDHTANHRATLIDLLFETSNEALARRGHRAEIFNEYFEKLAEPSDFVRLD
jgi:hypothetical protein